MMTVDMFRGLTAEPAPPAGLTPALQALWWAGRNDWDRAHECVQQHEGDADCDLVHAYLHRQEDDLGNARFWYRAAGRPVPTVSPPDEWTDIASALLSRHSS